MLNDKSTYGVTNVFAILISALFVYCCPDNVTSALFAIAVPTGTHDFNNDVIVITLVCPGIRRLRFPHVHVMVVPSIEYCDVRPTTVGRLR